jgi:lipoprotein-anchoring transpeptidase ErfK/SrfK
MHLYKLRVGALALALCAPLAMVGTAGAAPRAHTSVTPTVLTNRRAQQILSQLRYLPLNFTAYGKKINNPYASAAGAFTWRVRLPPATEAVWTVAVANPLEDAALYSFEEAKHLPLTTDLTTSLSKALVNALVRSQYDDAAYQYVYVSTSAPETTYVYANNNLVYHTLANTGVSSAPTQLGTFYVYVRYLVTTMSGVYPGGGTYSDPGIPWVSYFNGGDALHGFLRASYGWPQSLGCVEMPFANAHVVFERTAIGTPVTVAARRP